MKNVQPTFSRIWFDVKPTETKENNNDKYFFTSTNNDNLQFYDDDPELECEMYIRSIDLEKMLILIVSQETPSDLIRRAHNYSQIKAIFIVSNVEGRNFLLAYYGQIT
jgi:hypothetical protein